MRYNHCGVIVRHTLRAPSGAPPGNKGQIPGKAFGKKKCAHTRPRAGTESTTRLFALESVRVGVVGNISACHADARGSIPRRGAFWNGAAPNLGLSVVYLLTIRTKGVISLVVMIERCQRLGRGSTPR